MAECESYTPMSEKGRANVQSIIDTLTELGEAVGDWTGKFESRQTGFSYHAKFANKVDVMTTIKFVNTLMQSPAMLTDACRKLLAADAAASAVEVSGA